MAFNLVVDHIVKDIFDEAVKIQNYDLILCTEVIEHVEDVEKFIKYIIISQ